MTYAMLTLKLVAFESPFGLWLTMSCDDIVLLMVADGYTSISTIATYCVCRQNVVIILLLLLLLLLHPIVKL